MFAPAGKGFTLVELLFTLAVAGVLCVLAVPSFARLGARTRLDNVDNGMVAALHFARASAIQGGSAVLLCPSRDGRACSGASDWSIGWLVAADRNHDGVPDGRPLRRGAALGHGLRAVSSSGRRRVRYVADGSAPGSNLSIVVCQAGQADSARKIVVANSGRVRQGTPTDRQAAACAAG
ncbi:MAG TPA: GspH/FimT family pseudopilin [Rhodanobacteraceae bacterium]|nr:GspH/FimT family pseudopilin [Rhodanobacteraceae bacterium]